MIDNDKLNSNSFDAINITYLISGFLSILMLVLAGTTEPGIIPR